MKTPLPRLVTSILLVLVFYALGTVEANATVRRVPADYPTILTAIQSSVDGDTVSVAPGTYFETISFLGKAITVTSEAGPGVTIINGGPGTSVVYFDSGEGPSSVLRGFTVQGGGAGSFIFNPVGGGIYIESSSPKVTGNIIRNNYASGGGGGIGIIGTSTALIQGNVITHNEHRAGGIFPGGGGISVDGGASPTIVDNFISDNSSPTTGGGIAIYNAGLVLVRNNKIIRNMGHQGGGVYVSLSWRSTSLIVQNLIADNSTDFGIGAGVYVADSSASLLNNTIANNDSFSFYTGIVLIGSVGYTLSNNIIVTKPEKAAVFCGTIGANNTPPVFSHNNVFSPQGQAYAGACPDQTGMNGNVSADPLFLNPATGDYHLKPDSPSIDTGDNSVADLPSSDLDGRPRIQDGNHDGIAIVDMGAYEVPVFDLCVQDESNGNILQLNTTTGEYQFTNCAGLAVGGTGLLTRRGSIITLQHNASDRRLTATIDTSTNRASASLQLFSQSRTFGITDRNITNNTCTCK